MAAVRATGEQLDFCGETVIFRVCSSVTGKGAVVGRPIHGQAELGETERFAPSHRSAAGLISANGVLDQAGTDVCLYSFNSG